MSNSDKFSNEPVILTRQSILPGFENGRYEPQNVYDKGELGPSLLEEQGRRDSRLNVRVNGKDLAILQQLALTEQLPIQAYIANLVHHFSQGLLVYVADLQSGSVQRAVDLHASEALRREKEKSAALLTTQQGVTSSSSLELPLQD